MTSITKTKGYNIVT